MNRNTIFPTFTVLFSLYLLISTTGCANVASGDVVEKQTETHTERVTLPPLIEEVLQKINDSGQAQTPNAIQSETLPLNTEAIRNAIAEMPEADRWGGVYTTEDQTVYFGMSIVRVPQTNLQRDIRPLLANRSVLLAQNETALVRALDNYLAAGLFDDTVLLKQAYRDALSEYAVNGKYQKLAEFTFDGGEVIVGVVAVLKDNFEVNVDMTMENLVLKSYIKLLQKQLKEVNP